MESSLELDFTSHFHSMGNKHHNNNHLSLSFIQEKSHLDQHVFHMSQGDINSGNNDYNYKRSNWKRFGTIGGWYKLLTHQTTETDQFELWNIKRET